MRRLLHAALLATTLAAAGCPDFLVSDDDEPQVDTRSWGERDPARVPSWALLQERRCPKLPDADDHFAALAGAPPSPALDAALLVCHAEITHKVPWDALLGPDLLFQFQIRRDPRISLWGPEDHWDMYVSVPRVSLRRGDPVGLLAFDRDTSSLTFIGSSVTTWDGGPLRFAYSWNGVERMRVECRAMPRAQTIAAAAKWQLAIDAELARLEGAAPDPGRDDWGEPPQLAGLKGLWRQPGILTGGDGTTPMRYLAGFFGWEDPIIQERLARLDRAEAGWRASIGRKVAELSTTLPPPGAWAQAGRETVRVRVVEAGCSGGDKACTATLEVVGAAAQPGAGNGDAQAGGINVRGDRIGPYLVDQVGPDAASGGAPSARLLDGAGGQDGPARVRRVSLTLPASPTTAPLLRLRAAGRAASWLRLR